MSAVKVYRGVSFIGDKREVVEIRAKSTEGAKTQMKKRFGDEFDSEDKTTRWVVGLTNMSNV